MRKSFRDSLKALEADIQCANTLASYCPREYDGACLQMRLSYSPCAQFFLFLVQWADCHLAGALGLIRILIYKVHRDGRTTISVYERKASLREFYGVIFPFLMQLHRGITDVEDRKQKEIYETKYRRKDEMDKGKLSEIEIEREEECGICMEVTTKVVLPSCTHSMCLKCYNNWYLPYLCISLAAMSNVPNAIYTYCISYSFQGLNVLLYYDGWDGFIYVFHYLNYQFVIYLSDLDRRDRSQSCPFCRDSLKSMNSEELWIYTSNCDIVDLSVIAKENMKRLFLYVDKLPLVVPNPMLVSYVAHFG